MTAGHTSLLEISGKILQGNLGRTLEDGRTCSTATDRGGGDAVLEGNGGAGRAFICGLRRCRWRRISVW